jgi:hypothetical protein
VASGATLKGWGELVWCSCARWWLGGDTAMPEHMRAHPRHVWWTARAYPNEVPIGPPFPPCGEGARMVIAMRRNGRINNQRRTAINRAR